jgi:hypothetical protein
MLTAIITFAKESGSEQLLYVLLVKIQSHKLLFDF